MTITLAEVARATGLSRSLVSLALRGDDGVSAPCRERVVRAADELGLPVGALARRRASGDPLVLGVLVTDAEHPFHAEVLASAHVTAATLGFALRVVDAGRDDARLVAGLEALTTSAKSADGVLGVAVVSSRLAPARVVAAARRVPVAVLGSGAGLLAGVGVDTVGVDEESGMRDLLLYLASLGHVRTCFVAESAFPSTTRRGRVHAEVSGWLGAPGEQCTADIDTLVAEPARVARHLDDGVTAFVAANDATAARLLAAAHGAGLDLPTVAVVTGFDGTVLAERLDLTSVGQPCRRMGARVVELVVERLRGRRVDRHEVWPTALVPRCRPRSALPSAHSEA
ncbi:LacI family DNA-binding transcriptional regulator [Curtobacterium herbarum]|uniref:Substrate-binding domain-containing protein n=1 Tax=Curtobacterium herbarum TaxID=150122 RepID=A0ABN1ZC00_9MICO|nr:LacI family DNA-binding transcriptional regulator [Curtobacterium herbarum]MBM7473801.1 DNA-binding LacI/PurR family transcriptional regulator [Curtobacterium herbarum]MCS6544868.1 LacI family transcriptional regulator [Curtobacterium herbarum]